MSTSLGNSSIGSTELVMSPGGAAAKYLLEIKRIENEISELWTNQQNESAQAEGAASRGQAKMAKATADHEANALQDEAYGLFASGATGIATAGASFGMQAKIGTESNNLQKSINEDRAFKSELDNRNSTQMKEVTNGEFNDPAKTTEDNQLIRADEKITGKPTQDHKEGINYRLNEEDLETAKKSWGDRIKAKEKQQMQLGDRLNTFSNLYVMPLGQAGQNTAQGAAKIASAAEKSASGDTQAEQTLRQEQAALMTSSRNAAEKTSEDFVQKATQVPQLLSEIENSNIYRG